jgi:ribose 5-phosphate isomerase B
MKIYIASDHGGFSLKQGLIESEPEFEWCDLGAYDEERSEYPDLADKLCKEVIANDGLGILVCGTGIGMSMRANKYQEIRAALCWSEETGQLAKAHNRANVICLGGRFIDLETARKILKAYISADFEGGRHVSRLEKVNSPIG